MTIQAEFLTRALQCDDPLKAVDFILAESTEFKNVQNVKKWSNIPVAQQEALESFFIYIVAERHEIKTGFHLDPTDLENQARKLKIQFQKRISNNARPPKVKKEKNLEEAIKDRAGSFSDLGLETIYDQDAEKTADNVEKSVKRRQTLSLKAAAKTNEGQKKRKG